MADMYKRIDSLLKERGISGAQMSKDLGMSRSFMTELRSGRAKSIKVETAQRIADYFGVTTDYLLGTEPNEKAPAPFTKRDERDIEKRLEAMLGDLEGPADGLMFSGEPLDDETRELLRASLRNQLEMTKRIAKQKYTPKKYRKKEGE